MFDLHRPGRDFELYSTVKDKKEGQTGNFQIRAGEVFFFSFAGKVGVAATIASINKMSGKILWCKEMHIIQVI